MKNIMQSVILLLVAASCSIEPSFSPGRPIESTESPEQLARQVIAALQHTSSSDYIAMFPTVEDFHLIMDAHEDVYGKSLPEAKSEFGIRYETDLLPVVKSFARTIREGESMGVAWNEIRFESVLFDALTDNQFGETQLTIEFSVREKRHKLVMEKVLIMNGEWKAGALMKLM